MWQGREHSKVHGIPFGGDELSACPAVIQTSQVCYSTLIHLLHYNVTGGEYTGSKKEGGLLTAVRKNCYFGVSK